MIGGGGRGGGGRDRFRREYSPRSSDDSKSHHHHHHHGRSSAPPSRHLWVGNLSHQLSESVLSEHFLRFGELESMAFQPGRSYAFVNFRKEEDAIIAMRGLQGFVISGLPLRIEFAKAEKSFASHDQHQQWRDEKRSSERRTSLSQRDSRQRTASPEPCYPEKSKMGDKNAEPSEVLWIGFPAFLNVDEMILRRAFSPFGEIEKITVFPGRSYAFVQFSSVVAACRAKETLQGKLFDNPRVSICFAKSELGPSEHGRNSMNAPLSPHFKSYSHPGRQDRNFGNLSCDSHLDSPHLASNLEVSGVTGFGRKGSLWTGGSGSFETMRFQGPRLELGPAEDIYEHRSSPARDRGPQICNFSPGLRRKGSLFEDPPDFVENDFHLRETKKLKTGSFPPDKELPEYPFHESGLEKQQTFPPRSFLDLPERDAYDGNFSSGPFSYKRTPDQPINLAHLHGERESHWKATYDRLEAGSGSLPTNPVRWHTSPPKSHQSPLNDEWKWEGTIAKGGTPVCHARCFPVGKVMDIMLPEFLDCTARTGLDMLAKHFYQAANAWVVFFVPASDSDIAFYNEFMHYLGEKQRAAVAKLGEKTTLFLVPPSEFSEKVLKVPGKMSISGVILKFQQPSSDFGPLNHPLEAVDPKITSFQEDVSQPKPITSDIRNSAWVPTQNFVNTFSEPIPPFSSLPPPKKPVPEDFPYMGNVPGAASSISFSGSIQSTGASESLNESRYYLPPQHRNSVLPSNWSPHHLQSSNPAVGNLLPQVTDNVGMQSSANNTIAKEHPFGKPRAVQEASSSHYAAGVSDISLPGSGKFSQQETKPQAFMSPPVPNLQPEQLAQLATLIGQRQQSGSGLVSQPSMMNQPEHPLVAAQKSLSQSNASTESSTAQLSQVQQLLQQTSNALAVVPQASSGEQQPMASGSQGNQSAPNVGASREDTEADPQKRLQATLQLAAALLQQIQQQAKTV